MQSFFIYLKTRFSAAILFTGLVYFLLSKSGLILAIPGTNASPIFPAAGFALSAVLLLGKRSLFGIFLGSLFGNIFTLSDDLSFQQKILASILTGIGASLQAYSGYFFLKKMAKETEPFFYKNDVLIFSVFSVFISSVISASFGLTGLYLSGLIGKDSVPAVWLTWYLGDAMGVLIAAPLFLVWRIPALSRFSALKYAEISAGSVVAFILGIFLLQSTYPLYFIFIIILLAASLRYMQFGAVLFSGIISAVLIIAALRNFPVFSGYSLNEKLLILQAFIGVNSIAMLLLSVLLYQQQKAQESLLELNRDLDLKVMERTEDLQKSLAEIQKLKIMQDGDYFLTSLLIQPFIVNLVQSEKAEAEFLISQKKKFEFHNKKYEIGGDMCHAQNLVLEGKKYILFINSDAMGKSLQGAGGAIVFGSVLFSIIGRTRDRNISPEKWLSDAFQELNDVFLSFDGSMLVSVILCLLDEDTGVLYYINAEHPSSVIYRDNICEFIDKENRLFKLGSCFNTLKKVSVQTVSLNRNDTVILGSDGRDDIDLQENAHKIRKNFDETLFLRTVEEAEGDLKKIFRLTEEKGMITDDYSLMKIKYKNEIHPRNDIRKSALEHYNRKNFKEATVYAEKYAELFPGDTDIFYILGYIFRTEKNLPKAEYYSERVRLRNPYFLPNLISLAKIYISQNRLSDAQKILMECKEIDPDHPSVVKLEAAIQGEGINDI